MAVGFRSSSIRGVDDTSATSIAIPVPSGAAAGDIVICFVGQWESFGEAITPAAGFTQFAQAEHADTRITAFWKRLTGSDAGSYTFSWTSAIWSNGNALCITGAAASGDPIEDFDALGAASSSYPSLSVTTAVQPFLAWGAYNANGDGTNNGPTGFTTITAQNYGTTAWKVPGTTGSHTASGATANASMNLAAILAAVKEDGGVVADTSAFFDFF